MFNNATASFYFFAYYKNYFKKISITNNCCLIFKTPVLKILNEKDIFRFIVFINSYRL